MTVLSIVLGVTAVILLLLIIIQRREIKSISEQLASIRSSDTNELVHSAYGVGSFNELINEINKALKEARRQMVSYRRKKHDLEQMMTNISHDLRTPLTSALGYIDLIKKSDMPEEDKKREIEIVEQRLLRLEELINSFFEFSKIISDNKKPELYELNLVSVLEDSIAHYYDDYCGQGRKIEFGCKERRIVLRSNRNMLLRIFDNLISNAYKHSTDDLAISVEETPCGIRLSFENSLYDSKIDIARIFDEFYTCDLSRTSGGTGLGLAISKQLVKMLGGKISASYNGELFSIVLEL